MKIKEKNGKSKEKERVKKKETVQREMQIK